MSAIFQVYLTEQLKVRLETTLSKKSIGVLTIYSFIKKSRLDLPDELKASLERVLVELWST
ncbi:hypothetical protein RJD24_08905 [Bacillaceae bacterium IKA-2]|nr:hypothetical protein RJD24_08905 [Bacillaceae bacterium IKA-2]